MQLGWEKGLTGKVKLNPTRNQKCGIMSNLYNHFVQGNAFNIEYRRGAKKVVKIMANLPMENVWK